MRISLATIFAELTARNIRKTLAIYISSALTTVAIFKLMTETYRLSNTIFPILVTFLTFGLASAFIFAWYHGKGGSQPFTRKEALLHSFLLVAAIVVSFRVGGSPALPMLAPNAKTVAVLPFRNLSGAQEDEYFSDGITEDILTQLSKISDLRVISRTSAMKFKNSQLTIKEIAGELGAGSILEGSVQRVGSRVRITGQLINTETDEHIWSESYDRELTDIFALQSEVAQTIAAWLKAKLLPEERKRIIMPSTKNLDAYALYLKGRDHYYRFTNEDNERAVELFRNALHFDSTYALAIAGIADAYCQRFQRYDQPIAWIDSAIELGRRTVMLAPEAAEAYKALGLAFSLKGWYSRSIPEYERAVTLNPNLASVVANLGYVRLWLGRHDEAYPLLMKAIALTPTRANYYHTVAYLHHELFNDSLAELYLRKSIMLMPSYSWPYGDLCQLYLSVGQPYKARDSIRQALVRFPEDPHLLNIAGNIELFLQNFAEAERLYRTEMKLTESKDPPATFLGYAALRQHRSKEAERIFDDNLASCTRMIGEGNEDVVYRLDQARIYAVRGSSDLALGWLRRAIDGGERNVRTLLLDPMLSGLKSDHRFNQMINHLRTEINRMRRNVDNYMAQSVHTNEE